MSKIHVITIRDGKVDSRILYGESTKYHVKMYLEYRTTIQGAQYYAELRICERPYDLLEAINGVKEVFTNRFASLPNSQDTDMNFTLPEILGLIDYIESVLAPDSYPIVSRELKITSVGGDYPTIKVDYSLYE